MKKIVTLCMAGLLSLSLLGCSSSDEKSAKNLVNEYLGYVEEGNLKEIARLTNDSYDTSTVNETDNYKRSLKLMLERLDYSIEEVAVEENKAVVTVKISNVNYANLKQKAKAKIQAEIENLDDLSLEEKESKVLDAVEQLLPNEEPVEQTVPAYLIKDGDSWKFAEENSDFYNAALGY